MTLLLTGATGFLGPSLVDALLARPEVDRLVLLVRRPAAITHPRVQVVVADLADPDLALPASSRDELAREITGIVHAAGDTRFDAPVDAARAANVDQTRHLLTWAARCPRLDRFVFLSTAFVAGKRTGTIAEDELAHDTGFVNAYEQSKHDAERLLHCWHDRLPIAICRLSTVVGDSRSGCVPQPRALHHALRFLYNSLAPMLPGPADSPVDLIASDYAASAVACLATAGFRAGGAFHLVAGGDALPIGELLDLTMEQFVTERPAWRRRAIERPVFADLATFALFVRSLDELGDSPMLRAFAVIRHFAPQLAFPKRFDDRGSAAALARAGIVRPRLAEFYPRVVAHLVRTNWGFH